MSVIILILLVYMRCALFGLRIANRLSFGEHKMFYMLKAMRRFCEYKLTIAFTSRLVLQRQNACGRVKRATIFVEQKKERLCQLRL